MFKVWHIFLIIGSMFTTKLAAYSLRIMFHKPNNNSILKKCKWISSSSPRVSLFWKYFPEGAVSRDWLWLCVAVGVGVKGTAAQCVERRDGRRAAQLWERIKQREEALTGGQQPCLIRNRPQFPCWTAHTDPRHDIAPALRWETRRWCV